MRDLEKYKLYLLRRGRRKSTIDGQIQALERVFRETTVKDLDSYFLQRSEEGANPNYLNHVITVLRTYGKFIQDEELVNLEFFAPKDPENGTHSKEEIENICNQKPQYKGIYEWHHYKMNLAWTCLAYSGARPREIFELTIEQVDFGQMIFHLDGKMGKRKAAINPKLVPALTKHIQSLKGELLFPSLRDPSKPVSKPSWNYDFQIRLKRAGIKRKSKPHNLRHSFATRNWKLGVQFLKKQLGHKRLETTDRYSHMVTDDLVEAIKEDTLGKEKASYTERFSHVWKIVKKTIDENVISPAEEKKMRQDLLNLL